MIRDWTDTMVAVATEAAVRAALARDAAGETTAAEGELRLWQQPGEDGSIVGYLVGVATDGPLQSNGALIRR